VFCISSDVDPLLFPSCLLIERGPTRWHNQGSTGKVDGWAFLPSGLPQPPSTDISSEPAVQPQTPLPASGALLKATESVGLQL
jgi:hypothetical protein